MDVTNSPEGISNGVKPYTTERLRKLSSPLTGDRKGRPYATSLGEQARPYATEDFCPEKSGLPVIKIYRLLYRKLQ